MNTSIFPFPNLRALMFAGSLWAGGCSSQPLEPYQPLPFDGGAPWSPDAESTDAQPFHRDVSTDAPPDDMADAGSCLPDLCRSNVILRGRSGLGMTEGICLEFEETHASVGLAGTSNHSGVSVTEYDGDGRPDIYLLRSVGTNQMFRNTGGAFSEDPRLDLRQGPGSRDAVWGDFDGDGDSDLFLVSAMESRLYQRDVGSFVVSPFGTGIHNMEPGRTAVWLGAHLYLATENGTRFYRHLGGGRFEEAARTVGLDDPGDGSAIAVADYDGDGHDDIYLANTTGSNRLFRDRGDGAYESTETATGAVGPGSSTDATWVRIQEEARPSLYVANYAGGNQLYRNDGSGNFSDQAGILGVRDPGNTTRVAWGDFAGDRRPSLFLGRWDQPNLFYVPVLDASGAVTRYIESAHPLGMDLAARTVGAKALDYDGDSLPDLLVVFTTGLRLYHNISRTIRLCPEEDR